MLRRRSLDSAVSLQDVGTGKPTHGSRKGSLLIIRPPRASQSLEEAQRQIQELGRSLSSLRSQPIEEESPDQPDGLINNTSFVKQNKSFHKLFEELVDGEALTHTFTCALQKDGLYHGKLYLSVNFLCFYSSVLLKDTKVVIPVASVSEVKKHKLNLTMLSVRLATGAKYSFGSLRNREACYKMLQSICSQTQQGTESANSSPRVSSAENEVDRDIMSSPSSQSDSVQNSPTSLSAVDNVFPKLTDASPARRSSSTGSSTVEEASTKPHTPEDRAGGLCGHLSGVFETLPPLLFQKETNHLNAVFSIYLLLLVVLVITSGYMGLRILALEQKLNTMGALAEFSLQYKET